MKKLLSIFTAFTAVSVLAPTVVACSKDEVKIDDLVKAIVENDAVKKNAKESTTNLDTFTALVKTKLEEEIKAKLKGKKEVDAVAAIAKENFDVTILKEADKFTIKIKKADWKDSFVSNESKKADTKATYNLISGSESTIQNVPTK